MFTIRLCKHNLMQKSTLLHQTRLQPTLPYRKIPKISPGAHIFEGPFFRGLFMEGNLRFKIDWASLIVRRTFTRFCLVYFVFEGNFQVQAPGGLIFGGAYTWRGLFSEFYGTLSALPRIDNTPDRQNPGSKSLLSDEINRSHGLRKACKVIYNNKNIFNIFIQNCCISFKKKLLSMQVL